MACLVLINYQTQAAEKVLRQAVSGAAGAFPELVAQSALKGHGFNRAMSRA